MLIPTLLYNSYLVAYNIATAGYNNIFIFSIFASPFLICFQVFKNLKGYQNLVPERN